MPSNEKRWGFSLLSKYNHEIAYREEMMVDKLTGDIAIKTPKGDIISYNYNAKLGEHLKSARNDANNLGIYGEIYNVPFANRILPMSMNDNIPNLYDHVYVKGDIKRFMLHCDIDSVKIDIDKFSIEKYYGVATFGIRFHYDDGTVSDIITKNINTIMMNDTIFDLSNVGYFTNLNITKNITGIELTQFDITSNIDAREVAVNGLEIRHIINSLFIITEV